ncbi:MAG: hypothetical protein WBQ94_08845 [Terracidiphilus sp.]
MKKSIMSTTEADCRKEMRSTATNLQRMRLIDQAWNARDWSAYASFLSPEFVGHIAGAIGSHNKLQHVEHARSFCDQYPVVQVITEPYIVLFGNEDWTCSVACLDKMPEQSERPTVRDGTTESRPNFDLKFATMCRWTCGTIVEQYELADEEAFERLIGAKHLKTIRQDTRQTRK